MNIPDELLAAYADGELRGAERTRVEQAILHDARLAQRVAQYRSSRKRLRFVRALHEPIPQRLAQSARSASRPATAQVIDLATVRAERKRRAERHRFLHSHRLALAASLLGGLLIGALGERAVTSGANTQYRGGVLLAGGPLAAALEGQPLARRGTGGTQVQVGSSFKARSGDDCRNFSIAGQSLSGLACLEQHHWRIVALRTTDTRPR